jgi:hypothetical protein
MKLLIWIKRKMNWDKKTFEGRTPEEFERQLSTAIRTMGTKLDKPTEKFKNEKTEQVF